MATSEILVRNWVRTTAYLVLRVRGYEKGTEPQRLTPQQLEQRADREALRIWEHVCGAGKAPWTDSLEHCVVREVTGWAAAQLPPPPAPGA